MSSLAADLRDAMRSLRNAPGFAAVAIAMLALGIGATTTIFSMLNAVVLRPLKTCCVPHDELVRFVTTTNGTASFVAGAPQFEAWRRLSASFETVAAHRLEYVNLVDRAEPEQIPIARVTRTFFTLFHAPLRAGRTFTADDDRPGGPSVVVLSHGFWLRRFQGDPAVVGTPISLGNSVHVVVGILDAGFETEQFDTEPAAWVPFQIDPDRVDGGNLFTVNGRLSPGATIATANAELAVALETYRRQSPGRTSAQTAWTAERLREAMVESVRPSLNLLLAAVGFVLLIACANVANLLLVRGDVRMREVAIRAALGASRRRIVRLVLVEALMLSSTAGVAGLAISAFAVRILLRISPAADPFRLGDAAALMPRLGTSAAAVAFDWRVFVFAVAVCTATGILFGLWPALRLSRIDLVTATRRVAGTLGRGQTRLRAAMVCGEVALAVTLLIVTALLIRTAVAIRRVDPGFDATGVVTMRMSVAATRFETRDGLTELTREGAAAVRAVPGVLSAAAACCVPLETVWQLPFIVDGRPPDTLIRNGRLVYSGFAGWTFVSPGYFDVLGIPVLSGRDFSERDGAGAPGVAIINAEMARRFWPGRNPLGDRLIVGKGMRPEYDGEPIRQIIAVVGNVRDTGITRPARPAMYVPIAQEPDGVTALNTRLLPIVWFARTGGNPLVAARAIERALMKVAALPTSRTRTMEEVVAESTARARFNPVVMTAFGVTALLLAAVGVYGLMAYVVSQRNGEIGVRLALGAQRWQVASMVMREGVAIVALGVTVGIGLSFWAVRIVAGLLFQVPARDPLVFATVPLLLGGVAVAAVWVPARRAMLVDPIASLRNE